MQPWNGDNFYRLVEVNYDNRRMLSGVVKVYYEKNVISDVLIYPNPATDQVYIARAVKRVTIADITGRCVAVAISHTPGYMNVKALQPGLYFLHMDENVVKLVVSR